MKESIASFERLKNGNKGLGAAILNDFELVKRWLDIKTRFPQFHGYVIAKHPTLDESAKNAFDNLIQYFIGNHKLFEDYLREKDTKGLATILTIIKESEPLLEKAIEYCESHSDKSISAFKESLKKINNYKAAKGYFLSRSLNGKKILHNLYCIIRS